MYTKKKALNIIDHPFVEKERTEEKKNEKKSNRILWILSIISCE